MSFPDKVYTISSKRLFCKDHSAYYWRYKVGLYPKTLKDNNDFGQYFHHIMHRNFRVSKDPDGGVIQPTIHHRWAGPTSSYLEWARQKDDLDIKSSEYPFLIPLEDLYKFIGEKPQATGHFGGVLDTLVEHNIDQSLWVMDYKTQAQTSETNPLYDLEQIGLYIVALLIGVGVETKGGILNVVRLNYPRETRKEKGKDLLTTSTVVKDKSSKVKAVSKSFIIPQKGRSVKHYPIKDSQGRLIQDETWTSILSQEGKPLRRKLIVTRKYYEPTQEELKNIVRDFLAFVEEEQRTTKFYRSPERTSHWSNDFYELELRTRRGEDVTDYIQENFVLSPPHQEIREALRLADLPLAEWDTK